MGFERFELIQELLEHRKEIKKAEKSIATQGTYLHKIYFKKLIAPPVNGIFYSCDGHLQAKTLSCWAHYQRPSACSISTRERFTETGILFSCVTKTTFYIFLIKSRSDEKKRSIKSYVKVMKTTWKKQLQWKCSSKFWLFQHILLWNL